MKSVVKILAPALLMLPFTAGYLLLNSSALAETNRLVIEKGNNALDNEKARQHKEQWDETRRLRQKSNTRLEKEFDKKDSAIDARNRCVESSNVNAYWEPNTARCLDRRTGRVIKY